MTPDIFWLLAITWWLVGIVLNFNIGTSLFLLHLTLAEWVLVMTPTNHWTIVLLILWNGQFELNHGNESDVKLSMFYHYLQVCSTSWAPLWTSARIQRFTSNTSRLPVKLVKSKKWRESVERATVTILSVWRTSSRHEGLLNFF